MAKTYIFTSESVTEGHPDKVCDHISDAILDEFLRQDPDSRVAVETLVTTDFVTVAGEVTSKGKFDIEKVVRDTIAEIGYDNPALKFDAKTCKVIVKIDPQSPNISQGVTASEQKEQGAGDQGLMFGYATNETDELMPLPKSLAHKLTKKLADVRKSKELPWVRPDGKSQVSVEYVDDKPQRVQTVVISTQHDPEISKEEIEKQIIDKVIKPVCGKWWHDDIVIHVNPTGKFEIGGPHGDTGLTGRKIIVDTYGGAAPHGGGAFSGKDPSKVDRSAAYAARYVAKNVVASKIANKCLIQLAYAIGVSKPLSIYVNLFDGDEKKSKHIQKLIKDNFDLSPRGIREMLSLNRPIYECTSAYGHFGRKPGLDGSFSWEKTDKTSIFEK